MFDALRLLFVVSCWLSLVAPMRIFSSTVLETNMGNTNRDASVTTSRRGQLALYTWRVANNYPQNATGTRPEQPANSGFEGPSGSVASQAYVGAQLVGQAGAGCACSSAVTLQGYDKKSPGC